MGPYQTLLRTLSNGYIAIRHIPNPVKDCNIIVKAKLPPGRRQAAFGGLYDCGRFFALTGNLYPGSPVTNENRQAEIEAIHAELFTSPKPPTRPVDRGTTTVNLNDSEIFARMFAARNGDAVRRLWEGDVSNHSSHSEADLALVSHISFWTGGDPGRIDALFRQSGLYREAKWNRQDYREHTIARALENGRFYTPRDPIPAIWKPTSAYDMRKDAVTDVCWNMREDALTGKDIGLWHS